MKEEKGGKTDGESRIVNRLNYYRDFGSFGGGERSRGPKRARLERAIDRSTTDCFLSAERTPSVGFLDFDDRACSVTIYYDTLNKLDRRAFEVI